jgi:hypothetical protein
MTRKHNTIVRLAEIFGPNQVPVVGAERRFPSTASGEDEARSSGAEIAITIEGPVLGW